jgi:hypothetical protein
MFNEIEQQKIDPLPLIQKIGQSLGADLHLDDLKIVSKKPKSEDAVSYGYQQQTQTTQKATDRNTIEVVLSLSFPSEVDPDVGVRKINNLQATLQTLLPDYEVEITKQVAGLSYTGNFVGDSGVGEDEGGQPDYKAELVLREVSL